MSLNIVLLGYGKMGKTIEQIALDRGHKIALKLDSFDEEIFDSPAFYGADVVIEFTEPKSAYQNCLRSMEAGLPVVSGTTGWTDELNQLRTWVDAHEGSTLFWASNFSVGVNLFFEMNKRIAELMNGVDEYKLSMQEIHHIHKLDAPSGTAISLAEEIMSKHETYDTWALSEDLLAEEHMLPIKSIREGEVPGTHIVTYRSTVDEISLEHKAFGRQGFALGAVLAAEYVQKNKGLLSMKDLLKNL